MSLQILAAQLCLDRVVKAADKVQAELFGGKDDDLSYEETQNNSSNDQAIGKNRTTVMDNNSVDIRVRKNMLSDEQHELETGECDQMTTGKKDTNSESEEKNSNVCVSRSGRITKNIMSCDI